MMMAKPSPKPMLISVEQGQRAVITIRQGKKKLSEHRVRPNSRIYIRGAMMTAQKPL
jgi:hypothetical protein